MRSKRICWFFLLLFSMLGYAGQPVFSANEPEKASLLVQINGQNAVGHRCSALLQNCVINVTQQTTNCLSGSVSITNNSSIVAKNISASSSDANFSNFVVQNNGCPASLAPGASCTISFFTNASVAFTIANVLVQGTNTTATFFDMNAFICVMQPQITNISPVGGPSAGGQLVTITGFNFNATADVTFGGVAATVNSATATQIIVTTPPGSSGNVDVVVTVTGNASNAVTYTYAAPVITNISPASGPTAGGQLVTLTGANFNGSPIVTFDGVPASINSATNTQLIVTTPPGGPGSVSVVVTVAGNVSNTVFYTYTTVPSITNVAPTTGPISGGQIVTITGFNFSGGAVVTFGGSVASINSATATEIIVTTPPHAPGNNVAVVVTVGPQTSNTAFYNYVGPPSISNITPAVGPIVGGQTVTITGTTFISGGTTVSFSGTAGTNVIVLSNTQLIVTSPAHAAGLVNVTVTTVGGTSNTMPYTYSATAPVIVNVSPASGPASGGQTVTISGTNFDAFGNTVSFGGAAAVVIFQSAIEIRVTSPTSSVGTVNVVVTTSGVASNSFPYTYN